MKLRGTLVSLALLSFPAEAVALDLQESVAAALAFRPDLERQGALLEAAEAAIDAALADYLPVVTLEASAGWRVRGTENESLVDIVDESAQIVQPVDGIESPLLSAPPLASAGIATADEAEEEEEETESGASATANNFGFENDWRYGAALEVRQVVFDGFGTLAGVAVAEADRDGRLANVREAAELAALETVEAYLDVLRTRSLVEISEANLIAHRRLAQRVWSLGQGGQLTQADVAQSNARLALAEADLAERLGELAQAVARFVSRVGLAPDDLAPVAPPSGRPSGEEAAVATALAGHPGLAAANAAVAAGLAGTEAAGATFWPQVDLVARASTDRSIEILGDQTVQAEGLVELSWNLYRGGGDSALLRQARAELAAMRYDRAERRRTVEEEVRVAYRLLLTAEAVALPLRKHADATDQVLRAYGQQFDIGRRSLLDLLDAQDELHAAQLRATDAQYRFVLAHYELAYTMGILLATLGLPAPDP